MLDALDDGLDAGVHLSIDEETVRTAPVCPARAIGDAVRDVRDVARDDFEVAEGGTDLAEHRPQIFGHLVQAARQGRELVFRGDRDGRGQIPGGGGFDMAHQLSERADHETHDEDGEQRDQTEERPEPSRSEPRDQDVEL